MKFNIKKFRLLASLLVIGLLALGTGLIVAQGTVAAGPQFNVNSSLFSNLSLFKGKTVTITLGSGQTMTGVVKDVTGAMLHLEKLSGKEFYDAIIPVDRIAAVEARVR
jgi:hypothetical protein